MVVEILITQRNREYPLTNQGHDFVLDEILAPFVVEARGSPAGSGPYGGRASLRAIRVPHS
jgi:hypothetical protein